MWKELAQPSPTDATGPLKIISVNEQLDSITELNGFVRGYWDWLVKFFHKSHAPAPIKLRCDVYESERNHFFLQCLESRFEQTFLLIKIDSTYHKNHPHFTGEYERNRHPTVRYYETERRGDQLRSVNWELKFSKVEEMGESIGSETSSEGFTQTIPLLIQESAVQACEALLDEITQTKKVNLVDRKSSVIIIVSPAAKKLPSKESSRHLMKKSATSTDCTKPLVEIKSPMKGGTQVVPYLVTKTSGSTESRKYKGKIPVRNKSVAFTSEREIPKSRADAVKRMADAFCYSVGTAPNGEILKSIINIEKNDKLETLGRKTVDLFKSLSGISLGGHPPQIKDAASLDRRRSRSVETLDVGNKYNSSDGYPASDQDSSVIINQNEKSGKTKVKMKTNRESTSSDEYSGKKKISFISRDRYRFFETVWTSTDDLAITEKWPKIVEEEERPQTAPERLISSVEFDSRTLHSTTTPEKSPSGLITQLDILAKNLLTSLSWVDLNESKNEPRNEVTRSELDSIRKNNEDYEELLKLLAIKEPQIKSVQLAPETSILTCVDDSIEAHLDEPDHLIAYVADDNMLPEINSDFGVTKLEADINIDLEGKAKVSWNYVPEIKEYHENSRISDTDSSSPEISSQMSESVYFENEYENCKEKHEFNTMDEVEIGNVYHVQVVKGGFSQLDDPYYHNKEITGKPPLMKRSRKSNESSPNGVRELKSANSYENKSSEETSFDGISTSESLQPDNSELIKLKNDFSFEANVSSVQSRTFGFYTVDNNKKSWHENVEEVKACLNFLDREINKLDKTIRNMPIPEPRNKKQGKLSSNMKTESEELLEANVIQRPCSRSYVLTPDPASWSKAVPQESRPLKPPRKPISNESSKTSNIDKS